MICNYCKIKQLTRDALKKGLVVTYQTDKKGLTWMYVHDENAEPNDDNVKLCFWDTPLKCACDKKVLGIVCKNHYIPM